MNLHQREKNMVYIKKITTKGFKSYGNRIVSVTLSRNFTSIVGPNGSGKSNIIDAVSFVLGRLSTKSMRAEVLSDLIFTGSKKMNPAKYADVSLYLDNSDDELPFDRKEVIISRSVDASGKSVYRINRKRETRTYVLDILSQVGIFPEGHNIIMQGDITRFIKMSSWERRGVIEEISGIAEYNERRERGDRELGKAEDNIARVELVLNEVEKQMNRLENEKNDALRYQFLKDEIYNHKGWLYKGELEDAEAELEKTLENIEKNKVDINDTSEKITDTVQKIAQKEESFDLLDSEIEKLGEEKHVSITREIERLRGELKTMEQGLTFLEERKHQIETRKNKEEQSLEENKNEIAKEKERISILEKERKDLDARISKLKQEYQKELSVLSETGLENLEKISQELDEKKDEFFSLDAHTDILENDIKTLRTTQAEVEKAVRLLKVKEEATSKEGARVKDLLSETESRIIVIDEKYASLEKERKGLKRELSQIDTDFLQKRSESIRLHSKLQAFREDQRASPYKAVNTILEEKNRIKGIFGTISQLGEAEARYQTALEVAAGSRLHDIVVDTTETAKKCIEFLKKCKAGRATFLPLDRIQKRSLPPISKEGVIDYAINLVDFDPEFKAAFDYVFTDTLVVKDLDVDVRGARLVTLEGDVYERGGAVTGGHYFKRKYSSAFLISEDERNFRKVQEELQSLKKKREDMSDRLSVVEPELQKLYDEKIKLEERLPSLKREYERVTREESTIHTDMEEKENRLTVISEALHNKNEELNMSISKKDDLRNVVEQLEREKEELSRPLKKDELAKIEGDLEAARTRMNEVDQEITETKSRLHYLKDDVSRSENIIRELFPQIEEIEKDIEQKTREKHTFETALQERIEEEEGFDERIRNLRTNRNTIREDISRLRQEKEALQKRVYQCESTLKLLENQKAQLEEEVKELQELSGQYPVEGIYEDLKELKFRIKQMEKEKESLEPINMRAVEEFEEVQLRFITLKTRIDQLYEERQSILDFIAEVESQKKTVFLETYYKVAENFAQIFAELSPGGSGSLILESEEDPFAGGLEVEASPQGKELKRVEAMSGGEKALTALAFVFAVQQYKPAPFYVFDEIDAHLDDENVTRVAQLIKRASEHTQFIVITLRDAMMATADILYGVSMTEGISKIVSVELEKIAEYKEPEEAVIAV
ncbi:MAG: chromosome segregation protein SMC [Theionarchaea archaeon]|nr:chromosome segregation protein SMC [Theionarchaea archaeon]